MVELAPRALSWFEGYGIELEWMVVSESSLAVCPVVDQVLEQMAGKPTLEVEAGPIAWSNELALHVIEMKTNGPTPDLGRAAKDMQQGLVRMNALLAQKGMRLMPTGMHPLMQPDREFKLWPSDEEGIYAAFDRIFDCRGHGWANLQSMHINLPFQGDEQFGALHDAVRALLPLLPALSASSPLKEGTSSQALDERLFVYRNNARRVPEVSGCVVPERARSKTEYHTNVLEPIYRALAPHDPEGTLAHEWVNARGAIARFDRNAIEIRVLDTQECVVANLAIAHGVVEVLRDAARRAAPLAFTGSEQRLSKILDAVATDGDRAVIDDEEYLAVLGQVGPVEAGQLWSRLLARVPEERRDERLWPVLQGIVAGGCLARRIRRAVGADAHRDDILRTYRRLCDCLRDDEIFAP